MSDICVVKNARDLSLSKKKKRKEKNAVYPGQRIGTMEIFHVFIYLYTFLCLRNAVHHRAEISHHVLGFCFEK
jgi:hypothetical protein